MQNELLAANPMTRIRIQGVNDIGAEGGVDAMCAGRDIPLLQDTFDDHVWTQWQVVWRDVVILDEQNRRVAVYNVTEHTLTDPDNFAELKALLLATAGE
ncbi:MAG: hypothetical protein ACYTDU_01455 [Planctomycetota bacterium]|jgi:hypothetical protein